MTLAHTLILCLALVLPFLFSGCAAGAPKSMPPGIVQKNVPPGGQREIYLAGGCFWGMETLLRLVNGVTSVESGYANGYTENPSYRDVCNDSGHAETVHVVYDPTVLPLRRLLDIYFRAIDPTAKDRQGNDRGVQYRTGIYYTRDEDAAIVQAALAELQTHYDQPLAIEAAPLVNFYRAEEEHQEYLIKNPQGYCHIPRYLFDEAYKANRRAPGQGDAPVTKDTAYQKPDAATLKGQLTPMEYAVTQEAATEPPFQNAYDKEFREGIYCDVTTGQPLFISTAKFESGCGWPAFSRPIDQALLEERPDHSHGMTRTEVVARASGAHLGHVFDDGPQKDGGLRYCINSAALRFIPREEMAAQGYAAYLDLFDDTVNP